MIAHLFNRFIRNRKHLICPECGKEFYVSWGFYKARLQEGRHYFFSGTSASISCSGEIDCPSGHTFRIEWNKGPIPWLHSIERLSLTSKILRNYPNDPRSYQKDQPTNAPI